MRDWHHEDGPGLGNEGLNIEKVDLRVELGAEGRQLDAFEEALDELFGLPRSVGRGSIVDQDWLVVAEGQLLLDLAQKLLEVVLVGALAEVADWLLQQRRDRAEYRLRQPLVSKSGKVGLVGQLPGLCLALAADECRLVDVDQALLGGQQVSNVQGEAFALFSELNPVPERLVEALLIPQVPHIIGHVESLQHRPGQLHIPQSSDQLGTLPD